MRVHERLVSWIAPLIARTTLSGCISGREYYSSLGERGRGTIMVTLRGRSMENVNVGACAKTVIGSNMSIKMYAEPTSHGDERLLDGGT